MYINERRNPRQGMLLRLGLLAGVLLASGVLLAPAADHRDGPIFVNTPANDLGPEDIEAATRKLAEKHGATVQATVGDALLEKNFPILHERMRGVASAFGQRLEDDAYNHSGLGFAELRAGWEMGNPPRPEDLLERWPGDAAKDLDSASILFEDYLQRRRQSPRSEPDDDHY